MSNSEMQPVTRRRRKALYALGLAVVIAGLFACAGFFVFVSQLRGSETTPTANADGIVVLTGGSSRVVDAMELLAGGFGRRLLISGVHRTSGTMDISRDVSRAVPNSQRWLTCCVDLDHTAFNTRSNAVETQRWASDRGFRSLIVVTSNYHMPRAIVELKHVMPDVTLIPFPVVGDTWRAEPWWSSGSTMKLLLSEYAKYVVAEARVRIARVIPAIDDVAARLDERFAAAALAN